MVREIYWYIESLSVLKLYFEIFHKLIFADFLYLNDSLTTAKLQLTQMFAKQHSLAFRNSLHITIINCLDNLSTQSCCRQAFALAIVSPIRDTFPLQGWQLWSDSKLTGNCELFTAVNTGFPFPGSLNHFILPFVNNMFYLEIQCITQGQSKKVFPALRLRCEIGFGGFRTC